MKVSLIDSFQIDPTYNNFDWKKFSVYDDGKFYGHIFETNGEYLTIHNRHYYKTQEEAARFLLNRIKKGKKQ